MEIIATANIVPHGSKGRQIGTLASKKREIAFQSEGSEVSDVILDDLSYCSDGLIVSAQQCEYTCSICLDEIEQPVEKDWNARVAHEGQPTLSCDVVFEKHDGELCTVAFTHRPLGVVTSKDTLPVTVVSIFTGSAAEELGVENGWIVRAIAGVDVNKFSFKEYGDLLRYCIDSLPMKNAQCTGCHAMFHCGCLQAWLAKGKDTCPNCRQRTLPLALTRDKPKESEQNEPSSIPVTPRPRSTPEFLAFLRNWLRTSPSVASDYRRRR